MFHEILHKCIDQENIPLKSPLLQLNSNIIQRENYFKFLGVILDENLKKHGKLGKNIYNLLKIKS